MGIYIKGMEMPTNCGDCYFEQIGAEEDVCGDTCISYCLLTKWKIALFNRDDMKLPSCPLVEILTPHGRLIDEQKALLTNLEIFMCDGSYKNALKLICEKLDNAPTILEAEE